MKQSPRCWNFDINTELKGLGFIGSKNDPCSYTKFDELVIIAFYADDIVIAAKSDSIMSVVKNKLSELYDMKDLGKLTYFLGIEVVQKSNEYIWMGQAKFCESLLSKYNMNNCKPVDTPVDCNVKLTKADENSELFDKEIYQSCVGSLLYLCVKTRPDIAFAVNSVTKFFSNPTKLHRTAVKRILRYLRGTSNLGLYYSSKDLTFSGYSDADFGGDIDDRKSTSGYSFIIGDTCISWSRRKQTCVALSTAEAEYVALAHACQEGVLLGKLEGKYTEWPNPQIRGENRQSVLTD